MTATDAPSDDQLIPVRVLVRQVDYFTKEKNALGYVVDVIKTAFGPGMPQNDPAHHPELEIESQEYLDMLSDYEHGELIMLRPYAYDGLVKTNSVREVTRGDDGSEEFEDEELLDVSTASVDDLAAWIAQEHPTVNDVIQASNGEADLAQKLLEAESKATDGEPRTGVVKGLSAVISRA